MKRFAIYFAPPEDSPLSRLATAWLGRDAFDPFSHSAPDPPRNGFSREVWRAATSDPRLYGFHATLKPPFAPLVSDAQIIERTEEFAATHQSFLAPPPQVASLSSFVALTLSAPCPALDSLAADCVRDFDSFRAPPSEAELTRRRRSRLTPKQLDYLVRWGYPYVFDEWRFHMTLSSSLEPTLFPIFTAHLQSLFAPHCQAPIAVDSICLFEQPEAGEPFHVRERFRLA